MDHGVTYLVCALFGLGGLLWAPEGWAQTTATFAEKAVGASCSNYMHATDFDTMAQCNNASGGTGTMQKAPLFVGQVTAPPYADTTCDSNKTGMIQWTGSAFQGCDGSDWMALGGGDETITWF